MRNLFKLKKEKEEIKHRIIRDVTVQFKQKDDYYKPTKLHNFGNNNYIEYESSGDRNNNLSVKECLDKIKPYLRDIITNLQKSDTWKIQLTIAINFISSKDDDEEHVAHSMSNNI